MNYALGEYWAAEREYINAGNGEMTLLHLYNSLSEADQKYVDIVSECITPEECCFDFCNITKQIGTQEYTSEQMAYIEECKKKIIELSAAQDDIYRKLVQSIKPSLSELDDDCLFDYIYNDFDPDKYKPINET